MYSSTSSLTGKNVKNNISLHGTNYYNSNNIPLEVQNIKINIFNNLIIPLLSKKWNVLKENIIFLDNTKKKIDYYYETYNMNDLIIYKDLLHVIELMICEHYQLEDLERKMFGNKNELSSMVYKTTMVRLKPEYELYDIILGIPNKNNNEKYNESILNDIANRLSLDDMNFNRMKEYIIIKYNHFIKNK
jgi:hypothetical protein